MANRNVEVARALANQGRAVRAKQDMSSKYETSLGQFDGKVYIKDADTNSADDFFAEFVSDRARMLMIIHAENVDPTDFLYVFEHWRDMDVVNKNEIFKICIYKRP